MENERLIIKNVCIVLRNKTIKGDLLIEDGRIAAIAEGGLRGPISGAASVDAGNMIIMPGLIDIHSDAIEKEIQPRPNAFFPVRFSLLELEKKLAVSGITTMYHSVSLSDDWGMRSMEKLTEMIREIRDMNRFRPMINHRVHLRYEIGFCNGVEVLEGFIREKLIDLVSYMDHTPGQGQFNDPDVLLKYTMGSKGLKAEEAELFLNTITAKRNSVDFGKLKKLAGLASEMGISLATHDDDNEEKIDMLQSFGGKISEFPVNFKTAGYAASKGLHVCVGAPNIIRGVSHSNNMRAIDAIEAGAADIICSDYLPSCMLLSAMLLTGKGLSLPEAAAMVTLNPARAVGIDGERGVIEEGKAADLVVFEMDRGYPVIRMTITAGHAVYKSDYVKNRSREEQEALC